MLRQEHGNILYCIYLWDDITYMYIYICVNVNEQMQCTNYDMWQIMDMIHYMTRNVEMMMLP